MRRLVGLLLVLTVASCGGESPELEVAPRPTAQADKPRRRTRAEPGERVAKPEVPIDEVGLAEARTRSLLQDLADPATREAAEARLEALPDAERIAMLRRGLLLADDLALEAAQRLEYQYLDADESERFVALLLPHLFDESDDIDLEELRSALGSSEIHDVLQEMREHQSIAGERSLLGALHRQLRACHLPELVEMALSPDRALAEQALQEIAIVAMYTNRHRRDVARIFAGRAEVPERTFGVPGDLVVALRAILADDTLGEVRRSMFLAWALRWLRDCKDGGGGDQLFLRELIVTARTAPGLSAWERENVQVCAVIGLADKDARWLRENLEEHPDEWRGDAALAARAAVLADRGDKSEVRSLAGAVPLVLALLMELEPREGEKALFEALDGRKPHAALEFMDDVYHSRFRLRLPWHRFDRWSPNAAAGMRLDPVLMLRLAIRYPEFNAYASVKPVLKALAASGGVERAREWLWEVLPSMETDALREVLRRVLEAGTARDRSEAAHLLARLRDGPSEAPLIDLALAGRADSDVLPLVAEWATTAGKERIRESLDADGSEHELRTLGALGGLPRELARRFGEVVAVRVRGSPDRAADVVTLLRDGDAVGALLLHLDVKVHEEIDGIGRLTDARVVEHLRTWAARREDGRAHWALGELALAGDSDTRRQIEDIVEVGRYRWVDDASADVLLLGSGGQLGFWGRESESNCCRAVPVTRVFEDGLRVDVSDEMNFQAGVHVTLAEWLRWRLGATGAGRWLLTDRSGASNWQLSKHYLVWSDIEDGYVPSLR